MFTVLLPPGVNPTKYIISNNIRQDASRRAISPTTHNIHERGTSVTQAGFEPATPASERLKTHALDRAVLYGYRFHEESS